MVEPVLPPRVTATETVDSPDPYTGADDVVIPWHPSAAR
jgi:hypothetical protein